MTLGCHGYCSGDQVVVSVQLEREDEEEVSPFVMAPFFPQVREGDSGRERERERERERCLFTCSVVKKAGGWW